MIKTLIPSVVLLILLTGSCNRNRNTQNQEILPEKKMVELLVETHLADAILFIDTAKAETKRDKALYYYPSVLEKQGIEKSVMDSSVAYYMRNPAAYARIYAEVIKRLEALKAKEQATPKAGK